MAEGGHPSVYVVDSHATFPPVPPRLSQGRRRAGVGQTLLFILMSVALCGMTIEACLIYRLYQTESVTSASVSKIIAEQDATAAKLHSHVISPSKPVAHLTDGQDVVHAKEIMAWSTDAEPRLYEIEYKKSTRSLVIQKEGYYYVYSKVSFTDKDTFHHRVDLHTEKFTGKSINLLKSRKYSNHFKHPEQSNSYLGGVFHFSKGDAIFVKVSNTSKIVRQDPSENVFGAYMI